MAPRTNTARTWRAQPSKSGTTRAGNNGKRKKTSSTSNTKTKTASRKRPTNRALGAARRSNDAPKVLVKQMTYNWPMNLPYQVMLQIFQYAAYPLVDDQFMATQSVAWLLKTSRVCRSFMEPALSALYYSPPLQPAYRAHGLLQRLGTEEGLMKYQNKIRYLEIEAISVLTLKHAGQNPIDLKTLIPLLPQLQGLRLHLDIDLPGSSLVARRVAPLYTNELFDNLDAAQVMLRQWKWNYHIMTSNTMPWKQLSSIHSRRSFRMLKELEITHLGDPHKLSRNRWQDLIEHTALALGNLEVLQDLTFTKCHLNSYEGLLRTAPQLRSLHFTDCDDMTSEYLLHLLKSHGNQLEILNLKHNRALDIGFSSSLSEYCPNLKSFIMNFQCLSGSFAHGTAEPSFETVLPAGMRPNWPSSLQHLETVYIRKWDLDKAKEFFLSILDAAERLSQLRSITIITNIDCDWKERISFRDTWIEKMDTAFRRRCPPPTRYGSAGVTNEQQQQPTKTKSSARLQAAQVQDVPDDWETRAIQPLCEVVDIKIDNLRPMQNMFNETDFMDAEPSDDDDFDPDRMDVTQEAYAW